VGKSFFKEIVVGVVVAVVGGVMTIFIVGRLGLETKPAQTASPQDAAPPVTATAQAEKKTFAKDQVQAPLDKATDSKPLVERALEARARGDANQAISLLAAAIQIDPNNARAYYWRGRCYYGKDQFNLAINDYNTAIRLDPKFAAAYTSRGRAYSRKGQYDQAIADCTEAIRLNPNDARAYQFRSIAYRHKGDTARSRSDNKKALSLNPNVEMEGEDKD